jgi:hypothetical protein
MDKFISSFEEACAKLGRGTELPDVTKWPERLQKHLTAVFKLDAILEVNNDGWVADLSNTKQWKYYPWFRVVQDVEAPGGFRLSFRDFACDRDDSSLGVRLACKSEELAVFMGNNCGDLYKDLHS